MDEILYKGLFFFSALGVGMVRDSGSLMVGQYFRKKRGFVEMLLTASTGIGIATMSDMVETATE